MSGWYLSRMNESTRKHWNDRSDDYFDNDQDIPIIINDPARAFPRDAWDMLRNAVPDLRGKRVLVPSSGDNKAVFGLCLLGAKATSTDLAEKQLENAAKIAEANGWDIEFRHADSMTLEGLPNEEYDLVYTSNGCHVWISDLSMMYRAFSRVLKPGGTYVFFETHPFWRPFDDSTPEVRIVKPYTSTGPFGDPPNYHWRVGDFLRALLGAGFAIEDFRDMEVYKDDILAHSWYYSSQEEREKDNYSKYDWTLNPWAALPTWMGVSAKKNV